MTVHQSIVRDTEALEKFQRFLSENKLPAEDLSLNGNLLISYHHNNEFVGTGGLEFYEGSALLRSVAVKSSHRGTGLGKQIVDDVIQKAKDMNVGKIFLLTETAHDFFLKKGFKDVARDSVHESIKTSSEFAHVCPVSAAVMMLEL